MPERLAEGVSQVKIEGDDAAPQIDRATRTSCYTRGVVMCRHHLRRRMRRSLRNAEPTASDRHTNALKQRIADHRSVCNPNGHA